MEESDESPDTQGENVEQGEEALEQGPTPDTAEEPSMPPLEEEPIGEIPPEEESPVVEEPPSDETPSDETPSNESQSNPPVAKEESPVKLMPEGTSTPKQKTSLVASLNRNSTMSYIPFTDEAILEELKKADEESRATIMMMQSMKQAIEEMKSKPVLSDEDSKLLEERQIMLLKKLSEFEDITRKMQRLMGLTGLSSTQFQPSYISDTKAKVSKERVLDEREEKEITTQEMRGDSAGSKEEQGLKEMEQVKSEYIEPFEVESLRAVTSDDALPKVVVCGWADGVPKIIVCRSPQQCSIKRCCDSICALKQELIAKENAIQCMKITLCSLEIEMRRAIKDNSQMKNTIAKTVKAPSCLCGQCCTPTRCHNAIQYTPPPPPSNDCVSRCPGYKPVSCGQKPLEDPPLLQKYCLDATTLESQLVGIEKEVEKMKAELAQAKKEGQDIDDQRKLLQCTLPAEYLQEPKEGSLPIRQPCGCPRSSKHPTEIARQQRCCRD